MEQPEITSHRPSLRAQALPWLQLLRPANIVTAWADVLAGFAVATAVAAAGGGPVISDLFFLLLATTGLYGGGVVLNDVFDATLDAEERPERPIPSGRVDRSHAAAFGAALILVGVMAGFGASLLAGAIAAIVGLCAVCYDGWGKHHALLGPLNMGACRGGNLLLGVAAVPAAVGAYWYLSFVPLGYVAAITAISRGEVHGGSKAAGIVSLGLIGMICIGLLVLSISEAFSLLTALPFFVVFVGAVIPAFVRGARRRDAASIRRAVKIGVLFLVLLDATLAAGFGGWPFGFSIAVLLPASLYLSRIFAVT